MNVGGHYVVRLNNTYFGAPVQSIAKIWIGTGQMWYKLPGSDVELTNPLNTWKIDVLACPPCGSTVQFPENDIVAYGFPSGTYYDGTTLYPGTGVFYCNTVWFTAPGRVQLNAPAG